MYIVGFIIPVPQDKRDVYQKWSAHAAELLLEYGCLEIVDAWEDNIPTGQVTDFRRAVDAGPEDKIVLSWQKWPDKQHVDAVERAMMTDPRFDPPGGAPFDQRRLIMGGFVAITAASRSTL
ncbi:MAG: DUF1428 domain-containing protein [Pseudomonadota bacterium]